MVAHLSALVPAVLCLRVLLEGAAYGAAGRACVPMGAACGVGGFCGKDARVLSIKARQSGNVARYPTISNSWK